MGRQIYLKKKVHCFYNFFLVKKEIKSQKKNQDAFSHLICAATMSTTKFNVNKTVFLLKKKKKNLQQKYFWSK